MVITSNRHTVLKILRFNLWAIHCWEWNATKVLFSRFRDNLLAWNHWLTFSSSTFKLVSKFKMLGLFLKKQICIISKKMKFQDIGASSISFIYKGKRSRLSIDPWPRSVPFVALCAPKIEQTAWLPWNFWKRALAEMGFPAVSGMFSMILDKVYFFWAGSWEGLAGAMWLDSWRISAGYRLLLTTLIFVSYQSGGEEHGWLNALT